MFSSDVAHSKGGPPSHIRGVEKLTDKSGARFEWHGKTFKRLMHSKWEVLGMGEEGGLEWCVICEYCDDSKSWVAQRASETEGRRRRALRRLVFRDTAHDWQQPQGARAIADATGFQKTMFTPAGCDLLARPKDGANPSAETRTKVLNVITAKLENIQGFAKMVESGFLVWQ